MPTSRTQQFTKAYDALGVSYASISGIPQTLAFPGNVTAGSLIVVVIASFQWYVDSITDTLGNTYTRARQTTQGGGFADYADIWYAYSPNGGANTVSPHYNNYDSFDHITTVSISEWAGPWNPADILGSVNGNVGTGTSVSPGSVTPTVNGALIISVATDFNSTLNASVTNQTGYTTNAQNLTDNTVTQRMYSEYLVQAAAAATTALFTLGSSSTWQSSVAIFKPSTRQPRMGFINHSNPGVA